ncbi:MAG TPA: SMP-30/gluconolactonase/LRE family protein [Albitalea sp.]|nr:SMP-30/gluconolactonase/LRE family protein [Albitalea sp.]
MNSIARDPGRFDVPRCGTPEPVWPAGALLGEGLCWSPDRQSMYWVDIHGQRLMRLHVPTGQRDEWRLPDTISAVAERAGGQALIVALRTGVAFFDPDSGRVQMLHEPEPQHANNRFNDGKCDAMGRFWAGTMDRDCVAPTGSLYRVAASGAGTTIECAWAAEFPVCNGPAWSRDGGTIWLNDTARNYIHAADFDAASGRVCNPRVWLRLRKGDGYPDGMTTDRDGRLWIAHWAGGCVTCHAPDDGRELARIALPASNVTNVAFGGADLTTLYVSTAAGELTEAQRAAQPLAGALFAVPTDAVGCAPHRFAG